MSNIIECGIGVQVKMYRTEEEPHGAFIVMIPEMNYTIYGGWKWGPRNPTEPSLVETLIGAKEVLIANLKENIYKDGKNPSKAVEKINDALDDLLGKHKLSNNNMLTKDCDFVLNGKSYSCILKSEWLYASGWNSNNEISVKNSFEWWTKTAGTSEGILKQKFEFKTMDVDDWYKFCNGRTSKELAVDIVSQYV